MKKVAAIIFLCLSNLSFAEERGKLDKYVDDTENLIKDADHEFRNIYNHAQKVRSPSAVRKSNITENEISNLMGRTKRAMEKISKSLKNSCTLPQKIDIVLATAELNELSESSEYVINILAEERHNLFRNLKDKENNDQLHLEYARMLARLKVFNENLEELRGWINTNRVDGLTSELIAKNPQCAGKVASSGLFRKNSPQREPALASSDHKLGKLRIDMDFKQIQETEGTQSAE